MSMLEEIKRERARVMREFVRGEISHQTYFSLVHALSELEAWIQERERRLGRNVNAGGN